MEKIWDDFGLRTGFIKEFGSGHKNNSSSNPKSTAYKKESNPQKQWCETCKIVHRYIRLMVMGKKICADWLSELWFLAPKKKQHSQSCRKKINSGNIFLRWVCNHYPKVLQPLENFVQYSAYTLMSSLKRENTKFFETQRENYAIVCDCMRNFAIIRFFAIFVRYYARLRKSHNLPPNQRLSRRFYRSHMPGNKSLIFKKEVGHIEWGQLKYHVMILMICEKNFYRSDAVSVYDVVSVSHVCMRNTGGTILAEKTLTIEHWPLDDVTALHWCTRIYI